MSSHKRENCFARDAGKNTGGKRRSNDLSFHHQENIFAGTFADASAGVERDSFRVSIDHRFHADQLRIHIISGGLGHLRQCVRRHALPGTDANVHALLERFRPEIFSPFPAGHVNFDGAGKGIYADFAISAQDDRLQVAFIEHVICANHFERRVAQLIERVRESMR